MFASLKNKIKEETGSDINKITSSWRSGAFLNKGSTKQAESSTYNTFCDNLQTSPSSSGGYGDTSSESISPKLENYLEGRLTEADISDRLKERDEVWQKKLDELRTSLLTAQGEEAAAMQASARAAGAAAAAAAAERDAALRRLEETSHSLAAARASQDKLDDVAEELELVRRERSREEAVHRAALAEREARLLEAAQELAQARAALPAAHPAHRYQGDGDECGSEDARREAGCGGEQCRRERSVLRRQLQETRLALADIKTSWSGQIASLETQVARVSRQAGEEGAERRRAERLSETLREELRAAAAELAAARTALANNQAKVARLTGEVTALSVEARELRAAAAAAADRTRELECRLAETASEAERWRAEAEAARGEAARRGAELAAREGRWAGAGAALAEATQDCVDWQRLCDKERREKDEALLRNAQLSQTLELARCDARALRADLDERAGRARRLEEAVARHEESEAAFMIIQEKEASRLERIRELEARVGQLTDVEAELTVTVEKLRDDLDERNKKIKGLERTVSDVKKTLARELAAARADPDDAEISRRYLKHVVLRFVTAREEARQLTRALAVLLRLSAQEEASLRAALPPRAPLAPLAWLSRAGLSPS